MPPWEAIYQTDAERDQTFAEAVRVCESLRTWYARWGYAPVEVHRNAIDQRVNLILQTVAYALTRPCRRIAEKKTIAISRFRAYCAKRPAILPIWPLSEQSGMCINGWADRLLLL